MQGASNAAAGALSGPIDLLNMGLLAAGLPMPRAPFGGSQWMQGLGLTREPENFYAGLLGESAGSVLPIAAAAKSLQIAAALSNAGEKSGLSLSRNGKIRDAPNLPQRPFARDYKTAPGPDGSPLSSTIEGHPLTAKFVAGRRTVGGADQGLSEREVAQMVEQLGIGVHWDAPLPVMPKNAVGSFKPGSVQQIKIAADAAPESVPNIFAHEVGHAVHDRLPFSMTEKINPRGPDFTRLYKEMNAPMTGRPIDARVSPETYGYTRAVDIDNEYWAEALRAYLQNPNYIKSRSPQLAKQLREMVEKSPVFRRVLQLNSAAPAAVGAGLLGGSLAPQDAEASPR